MIVRIWCCAHNEEQPPSPFPPHTLSVTLAAAARPLAAPPLAARPNKSQTPLHTKGDGRLFTNDSPAPCSPPPKQTHTHPHPHPSHTHPHLCLLTLSLITPMRASPGASPPSSSGRVGSQCDTNSYGTPVCFGAGGTTTADADVEWGHEQCGGAACSFDGLWAADCGDAGSAGHELQAQRTQIPPHPSTYIQTPTPPPHTHTSTHSPLILSRTYEPTGCPASATRVAGSSCRKGEETGHRHTQRSRHTKAEMGRRSRVSAQQAGSVQQSHVSASTTKQRTCLPACRAKVARGQH